MKQKSHMQKLCMVILPSYELCKKKIHKEIKQISGCPRTRVRVERDSKQQNDKFWLIKILQI